MPGLILSGGSSTYCCFSGIERLSSDSITFDFLTERTCAREQAYAWHSGSEGRGVRSWR